MIDKVLNILAEELNTYCNEKLQIQEKIVILSNITNPDGSVSAGIDNKIIFTLVSINEDVNFRNIQPVINTPTFANFTFTVLFSACFAGNYTNGLRCLSLVIDFFWQKNIFTATNTPGMDADIEKITVQMLPMTTEEQYQLWGTLRTPYLPSAVYQLRVQTLQSSNPEI